MVFVERKVVLVYSGKGEEEERPFNGWSELRLALDGATGKGGLRLAALVPVDAVVVLAVGRPRSLRSGDL